MAEESALAERLASISVACPAVEDDQVLVLKEEPRALQAEPIPAQPQSGTENGTKQILSSTEQPSEASGATIYFPPNSRTSWPQSRVNQLFNIIYFGMYSVLFVSFFDHFKRSSLAFGCVVCTLIAAISCFFIAKHRIFVSVDDELPRWVQNALRAVMLLFPFVILCGAMLLPSSYQTDSNTSSMVIEPAPDPPQPVQPLEPANVSHETPDAYDPNGPVDMEKYLREFWIADRLYKKHEYPAAIVHYRKALQYFPKSEPALDSMTASWFNNYPYRRWKTIEWAQRLLAVNPKSANAHFYMAESYMDLKLYDTALPHAKFAVQSETKNGRCWADLSKIYLKLKRYPEALTAANRHVALHPKWCALSDRAEVYEAMGMHAQAEADRKNSHSK
jgi:hypothetical protein